MSGIRPAGAVLLLGLLGCTNPYSHYEDSLYGALRVPEPEIYAQHMELLGDIVEYYRERDQKPPPGILAEYGYYLARVGRSEEAKRYFAAEGEAYPESAVFMAALARAVDGRRPFAKEPVETGDAGGGEAGP